MSDLKQGERDQSRPTSRKATRGVSIRTRELALGLFFSNLLNGTHVLHPFNTTTEYVRIVSTW